MPEIFMRQKIFQPCYQIEGETHNLMFSMLENVEKGCEKTSMLP